MKTILLLTALTLALGTCAHAQEDRATHRNFPLVVTLQFHSFSLPFRNIKSHFENIGIGIGTQVTHSGDNNWIQHIDIIWYRNKAMGGGILFSTQTGYRPYLAGNIYTELKAGIGYLIAFRPGLSFTQENGKWVTAGRKGKGMLAIPIGLSTGYHAHRESTYHSPFLTYQMLIMKGYNRDIPLAPSTFIQAGSAIHYKRN